MQARWLHLSYDDFAAFTKDQVHLISIQENGFDYIEGFVIPNNGSLVYSLEATKYYNDPSQLDAVYIVQNLSSKSITNYNNIQMASC